VLKGIRNPRTALVFFRLGFELIQRDFRKYAPIALAIFAGKPGLERWRLRLIRASYLYFRYLDDVADGDRPCLDGPQRFLDRQSLQWCAGPAGDRVGQDADILFHLIWIEFARRNLALHRARCLALRIIKGLQFDLQRSSSGQFISRAELDEYYANIVFAPACFAHVVLGASADSKALREMSRVIGELQSLRDLMADWDAGRINIPREALQQNWRPEQLTDWRERETCEAAARLRHLLQRWPTQADQTSSDIMRPVVGTLLRWAAREYPVRRFSSIGSNV